MKDFKEIVAKRLGDITFGGEDELLTFSRNELEVGIECILLDMVQSNIAWWMEHGAIYIDKQWRPFSMSDHHRDDEDFNDGKIAAMEEAMNTLAETFQFNELMNLAKAHEKVAFVSETRRFSSSAEFAAELKKGKCYMFNDGTTRFYYEEWMLNPYRAGVPEDNTPIVDWFFCDGETDLISVPPIK